MAGINNDITMDVGHISFEKELKGYYQDVSSSITHIEGGVFAELDEKGIPYCISGSEKHYYIVTIIQYALICYEFIVKGEEPDNYKAKFLACINWLEEKKEVMNDCFVFRSEPNKQYGIEDGWISGMYQGQAISLYLRAYQLTDNESYLQTAETIFNSFKYDYEEGGFKRTDKNGDIWFEEYTTKEPSLVLNGFIYAILGLFDLYRVTGRNDVKEVWDNCVVTLKNNLHKYDVWYWSVYDQLKKQLVSYYYQKNVHIPLMKIMYKLTNEEVFNKYAIKWERNLNNPVHRLITEIMYRIQPRLAKFKNK